MQPSSRAHGLVASAKPLHFTPPASLEHLRQMSETYLASPDDVLDPEQSTVAAHQPLLPK